MTENIRARSIGQQQADAILGRNVDSDRVEDAREGADRRYARGARSTLEQREAAIVAELAKRETVGERQARQILGRPLA